MNLVKLSLVASVPLILAGCLKPPSIPQQEQDIQNVIGCVEQHWGEPVLQVAGECFQGAESAAVDVIADVEVIAEGAGAVAAAMPAAYAQDPRVQTKLTEKRAAKAKTVQAPAAAPAK